MPWTSNGCGTTSEFIELLNFGPGPVNIGCFILTTGKYSITIPPNTFIQPGEFYVIAGQNFIPGDCANIDSSSTGIFADLNWNLCGCTNIPVPTTGNGLMTDGGSSNTPLVLFDPNLNVIDAVVRSLPTESSTTVTTSTIAGACSNKTFNLGLLPLVYEELGMSAGRGNSFARKTDGDCGWVKDPQQSGNASNNSAGDVSDIRYDFSLINGFNCDGHGGNVSIYVHHYDYASVFPMTYTISADTNKNGIFDINDQYTNNVDSSSPSIDINGLPTGRYRITVSSVKGCYLKTFEFSIIDCSVVLPVQLESFTYNIQKNGNARLQWKVHGTQNVEKIIIQKAGKDQRFTTEKTIHDVSGTTGAKVLSAEVAMDDWFEYFQLIVVTKDGRSLFSTVLSLKSYSDINRFWPNPVNNEVTVKLTSTVSKNLAYVIYNAAGSAAQRGFLKVNKGETISTLSLARLPSGIYNLQIQAFSKVDQPISFRFVKH